MASSDDPGLFRKLAIPIAVVALAVGAFLIFRNLSGSSIQGLYEPKWMYNLADGKLVAQSAGVEAPAALDGGRFNYGKLGEDGPLVDAYIFTCGDATAIQEGMSADDLKGVDARLGYVTRLAPAGPEPTGDGPVAQRGELVSDASGKEWDSRFSQRGIKLSMDASAVCPDGSQPKRAIPH